MRVLTQEEADAMEAGIPNTWQNMEQQMPRAATTNAKSDKNYPQKNNANRVTL